MHLTEETAPSVSGRAPELERRVAAPLAEGIVAGLAAGVPQVLFAQIAGHLLDVPRERADIGPRFMQRLAQSFGTSLPEPLPWLLATAFHFGYAAGWGGLYGALRGQPRLSPVALTPLLATAIYTAAFSPWGAATKTRTERHPKHRHLHETLLHCIAAGSFSLATAVAFEWLRKRRRPGTPT